MGSQVSVCSQKGVVLSNEHAHPVDWIYDDTIAGKFQWRCARNREYQLLHLNDEGLTALHRAAKVGNLVLIEYIAQRGSKDLLNLGDKDLRSPLFCAVTFNRRMAARDLIYYGADVNMQCTDYGVKMVHSELISVTPILRTPLSLAVEGDVYPPFRGIPDQERIQRIAMAKLFLIHKAVAEPKPTTEEGIGILAQAQKEVDAMVEVFLEIGLEHTQTQVTIFSYADDTPEMPRLDYTLLHTLQP